MTIVRASAYKGTYGTEISKTFSQTELNTWNWVQPRELRKLPRDHNRIGGRLRNSTPRELNETILHEFYIQGYVHREIYANNYPTRCNYIQFIYVCKPLYMFRVVSPPIIRSSCHCIHCIRDWTGTQFPSSHVHDRLQLRFY